MKKLFLLFICLCISMTMFLPVSAHSTDISTLSYFKSFVEPIYGDELYRFTIINNDNLDVTEEFLSYTLPWYHINDWNSILDYTLSNSLNIRRFDDEIQLYSGDIGRTYSEFCSEDVYIVEVSGARDTGYIAGILGGTIYYNPNTGAVSYVSPVTYDYISFSDNLVYATILTETPSSSIGNYCGIFKVTCTATSRSHATIDVPIRMVSNNSENLVLQLKIYPEL